MKNIVGGEPSDPGERLRVKEDERGDHTVLERNVALVDGLPQQGESLVLGERGGVARGAMRDGDLEHVFGPHRPSQKGVGQAPGGVATRVPSIDIGLRALSKGPPSLGEVIEKGDSETNLVAGLLNLLTGERPAVGQGIQTALNVPGREELQKPPVPGVADGRQFLGEPSLE
ncbi:hypothetical protein [Streptomyces sp. NPDC057545]|uniref:hypothetical protein n=1 Tax=Streptomyces sp. NPDC057545 TaxID=3346164 RepID=UPI00369C10C5